MAINNYIQSFKEKYLEIKPFIKDAKNYRSYLMQFVDLFIHKIIINTSPIDYLRFKFYKGDKTFEEKSFFIGKRGSRYYPWENNLVKYIPIFDNKYLFKIFIKGLSLPQPELITSIGKDYEINNFDAFNKKMETTSCELVIKPISGSGGRGILFAEKRDGFYYLNNEKISTKILWEKLSGDEYIIEELVKQEMYLSNIYSNSLNSFRVITIKTEDGKWHVANFFLRIGRGGNRVDNSGLGGIQIYIDKNGRTYYPYDWSFRKEITHHPDTGQKLDGITISEHEKIIELALNASKKFNFMGTIGWDIAQTTNGLMIIEANAFYDCWYNQIGPKGGLINRDIADGLKKRKFYTLWDKTKIYPRFNRDKIIS